MNSLAKIISQNIIPLEHILTNHAQYFAHTKDDSSLKESLSEHTKLVLDYFNKVIEANNLEIIIDGLIEHVVDSSPFENKISAKDFLKELIIKCIYHHDFGKVNENFQMIKMKNQLFNKTVVNKIDSQHSILSTYLFIADNFKIILNSNYPNRDKNYLYVFALLFSYSILKHHGRIENAKDIHFEDDISESLKVYLSLFINLTNIGDRLLYFIASTENVLEWTKELNIDFDFFALLKLNSSLLTASDYYATNEFMTGLVINDFGIVKDKLKEKIISNTYEIPYNKSLIIDFDYYKGLQTSTLNEFSNKNLNLLRQKLGAQIISNIHNNISDKLFYIEAPTGSGKTNLSLLALSESLKYRTDITKVFYVFPFTTLITQTYNYFKKNLELNYSEISEIHSKASYNKKK